jgi:NADP-dependent 3-hydroxy acid dehydrogenase YdfG
MATPFADNVVILTGASSGIGRETALQLADQGARLALAARGLPRLDDVALACRRRGADAIAVSTDVTDPEACDRLVRTAVDRYGRVDTLVCNAGISQAFPFDALEDLALAERIMRVNYLGVVSCAHHALPHLLTSRGRFVAVASLAGKTGVPWRTLYAASKHALAGFCDSLRIELADRGVSVTVIYPDFVQTEVHDRVLGPDGEPHAVHPLRRGSFMSAAACARHVIRAAARRRREAVLGLRGKLGARLKWLVPGLVDRVARHASAGVRFGEGGRG